MFFFTSTVSGFWRAKIDSDKDLCVCVYVATFIYLFSGLDFRIVCFGEQVVSSTWRDLHVKWVMICFAEKYCYMYFHEIPFSHLLGFTSKMLWKSDLLSERNCSAKNNKYVTANVETKCVRGDVENIRADWAERINDLKESNEATAENPNFTRVRTAWKPQMKDPCFLCRLQENPDAFCGLREWVGCCLDNISSHCPFLGWGPIWQWCPKSCSPIRRWQAVPRMLV